MTRWIYYCDARRCKLVDGHVCDTPEILYNIINRHGENGYRFGRVVLID